MQQYHRIRVIYNAEWAGKDQLRSGKQGDQAREQNRTGIEETNYFHGSLLWQIQRQDWWIAGEPDLQVLIWLFGDLHCFELLQIGDVDVHGLAVLRGRNTECDMSIHGIAAAQPRVGLIEQEELQCGNPFGRRHQFVLVVIHIHAHTDVIAPANIRTPDRRSSLSLHWRGCHRSEAASAAARCIGVCIAVVDDDIGYKDHDGLLNYWRAGWDGSGGWCEGDCWM